MSYPVACQILRNVINHMAITNMSELPTLNEDTKSITKNLGLNITNSHLYTPL